MTPLPLRPRPAPAPSPAASRPVRAARPSPARRAAAPPPPARRAPRPPSAVLTDRGRVLPADGVALTKPLGEGSYGQVYEGALADGTRVVLKRCKARVAGAADFFDAEHVLNAYVSRSAKGVVAPFLGYVEVEDGGPSSRAASLGGRGTLTPGTWLVWRYEGAKTLATFLRRRDADAALAADLGVPEDAVAATVLYDVLTALKALHGAGVVHRDVKPANLVLAEPALVAAEEARRGGGGGGARGGTRGGTRGGGGSSATTAASAPRFKIIDLGAAADLRRGTNYAPDESVLDPLYCPPERFVLPTGGPSLAASAIPGAAALLGSVLWRRHAPDRFDSYSVGVLLMQVAVPRLRSATALRAFSAALVDKHGNDLAAWRAAEGARLPPCALDADDGAGWALAGALLRGRATTSDGDGGVEFTAGGGGAARPSAAAALAHPFLRRAVPPARRAVDGGGGTVAAPPPPVVRSAKVAGAAAPQAAADAAPPKKSVFASAASAVWKRATRRLFDLEAALVAQAGAVEAATTRVEVTRRRAAERGGAAAAAEAAAAEAALDEERGRLASIAGEFQATAAKASDTLAGIWGGGGKAGTAADAAAAVAAAAAAPASPPPTDAPNPVRDAAVGGVYSALKFTGVALKVASALASSVAARAVADDDDGSPAPSAGPSVERAAGLAFVDALRDLDPPPSPDADYDRDVAPRLKRDKRAARLPAASARGLYAAYRDALAAAAAARADAAAAGFDALLAEAAVPPSVPWLDAEPRLIRDARHAAAVAAGVDVRAAFEAARETAAAEAAFRDLLAEAVPAAGRRGDRWSGVRPRLVDHPAFKPVPELRRREIFADTRAALDAAAAAAAEAAAAAAAAADAEARARAEALTELQATREAVAARAAAKKAEEEAAAAAAAADDDDDYDDPADDATTVAALRAERERLRAEYEEMERRLREMEQALGE